MGKSESIAVSVSATVPTRLVAQVANRLVTSANMKVGAYTVANGGVAADGNPFVVSLTHTTATGADTLGTVTVTGTDLVGATVRETLTPVADAMVVGSQVFKTVTEVVGAGWVINGGNDTLVVGTIRAPAPKRRIRVHNAGAQVLYLGGPTVSSGTGVAVAASAVIDIVNVDPFELYGLSASGALDVRILSVW
jgi:hypothetical protein